MAEATAGESYDSKASAPLGAVIFTLLVSVTVVALRLYTRWLVKRRLWVDDYLALVSLFVTFGAGAAIGFMTQHGLGRHTSVLSEQEIQTYLRASFVSIVFYSLGLFTVKITFIFQYIKTLGKGWAQHRFFLATALVVALWSLSEFWINLVICSPISAFWDRSVPASCIPDNPHRYIYIAGDVLTATIILIMPVMFMNNFLLGRPEAVVVATVYALGLFIVVLQFVRIRYVNLGEDFTWENADRAALMMAELSVALFCACVPLLHPLAERFLPRWFCTLSYDKQDESGNSPGNSSPSSSRYRADMEQNYYQPQHHFRPTVVHPFRRDTMSGFGRRQQQQQQQSALPRPWPMPGHGLSYERGGQEGEPTDGAGDVRVLQVQQVDDSGDLSEEILGLQSTRKAMKRLSYLRSSHSESDVPTLAVSRAAGVAAAERRSLSRAHTSLYPPPAHHHHHATRSRTAEKPMPPAPPPPPVIVRPPPALSAARLQKANSYGPGGGGDAGGVASEKKLPPPQVHVNRGFGFYAEEYRPQPLPKDLFATS